MVNYSLFSFDISNEFDIFYLALKSKEVNYAGLDIITQIKNISKKLQKDE
jgi:hypothetical protein